MMQEEKAKEEGKQGGEGRGEVGEREEGRGRKTDEEGEKKQGKKGSKE